MLVCSGGDLKTKASVIYRSAGLQALKVIIYYKHSKKRRMTAQICHEIFVESYFGQIENYYRKKKNLILKLE